MTAIAVRTRLQAVRGHAGAWWSKLPRKTRRGVGIAAVGALLLGPGAVHWLQLSCQARRMARREFGFVRPGETMVKFRSSKDSKTRSP